MGSTLVAACMGAFALIHAPAMAQVEWVTSLAAPGASSSYASQSDCLMPRLGASSPILAPRPPASAPGMPAVSHWWARTQDNEWASSAARWTRFDPAGGATTVRTPCPSGVCGTPITADDGLIIADTGTVNRLRKFDTTGTLVWETWSDLTPVTNSGCPLVSVATNGDITFMVGSLLARANAAGNLLFQTETNRDYPRYLAVDSAGNTWIVSGYSSSGACLRDQSVGNRHVCCGRQRSAVSVADSASSALLDLRRRDAGRNPVLRRGATVEDQRCRPDSAAASCQQPCLASLMYRLTSVAVDSARQRSMSGGCASGGESSWP